jgi:hypothetical protein
MHSILFIYCPGHAEIARALLRLLDRYRGWEIDYMCTDDVFVKVSAASAVEGQGYG